MMVFTALQETRLFYFYTLCFSFKVLIKSNTIHVIITGGGGGGLRNNKEAGRKSVQ